MVSTDVELQKYFKCNDHSIPKFKDYEKLNKFNSFNELAHSTAYSEVIDSIWYPIYNDNTYKFIIICALQRIIQELEVEIYDMKIDPISALQALLILEQRAKQDPEERLY